MTQSFTISQRLSELPPYLFAELDQLKQMAIEDGRDVIDFGVGDPDLPTPSPIVEALVEAARNPKYHRYPTYKGMLSFREAVAKWYRMRFGVKLNPECEVLSLIGAKEGIGHIPLAFIDNKDDVVLVPNPGYPVYHAGTVFAGGTSYPMPLLEESDFLPVLRDIPPNVAERAKMMFLNYPNNPTGAVAPNEFFQEVVRFATRWNIIICHDATYSEISYNGYKPVSMLQVEGAKEIGVEFHSLSKTFNMTGWRIGFVVGNERALSALGQVKTNLDSGIPQAIQEAGIKALEESRRLLKGKASIYQERRDILVEGLNRLGLKVPPPSATFYVWAKTPKGCSSHVFAKRLLEECAIVVTPGVGFGKYGEGFVRFALTVPKGRIQEAIMRMKESRVFDEG